MNAALLVFAGGGAGSLIRYLLGVSLRHTSFPLPVATFVANMSACAIFAFVLWMARERDFSEHLRLLLLTGFCGGLSTFSAFGYETWLLVQAQQWPAAIINVLGSTLLALVMFYFATK